MYGKITKMSMKYFNVGNTLVPHQFLTSLIYIKKAVARINYKNQQLEKDLFKKIDNATDILLNKTIDDYKILFPLKIYQTGSGTFTNMNVNEVISSIANDKKQIVHPNDHVNLNQSSNDTISVALQITFLRLIKEQIIPNLEYFITNLSIFAIKHEKIKKVVRFNHEEKIITIGEEFQIYIEQLNALKSQLLSTSLSNLSMCPIGGKMIGNTHLPCKHFDLLVCQELNNYLNLDLNTSINKASGISSHNVISKTHQHLKDISIVLNKIANDLSYLSMGPRASRLNEYIIKKNEPGSSIFANKINPTQCESIKMISLQICSNDMLLGMICNIASLNLNIYKPLIAKCIVESSIILADGMINFINFCLKSSLTIDKKQIALHIAELNNKTKPVK